MDFIEKLFGLSPDNGDGSTEILWLAALASLLAIGIVILRRRNQTRRVTIDKKR